MFIYFSIGKKQKEIIEMFLNIQIKGELKTCRGAGNG